MRAQDFGATADSYEGGRPVRHFPSIDLAVAAFPRGRAPVWANVLFSREHPRGFAAAIDAHAGPVTNVLFHADVRDAQGASIAWLPRSDWSRIAWKQLFGPGPNRVVAPYPASLLKLMVAVGVGMGVDGGLTPWPEAAMKAMITVSDNDATTELVALLHRLDLLEPLHARLQACGLPTLQLRGTRADGGWGNAAGAGVGMIQMTAWDSARLVWLLDPAAPRPPWLHGGPALLSAQSRDRIHGWMAAQELHEILSSQRLKDVPGWVPGIPDDVHFAHKTGNTENYASDAGIARARPPGRRHYIVAVLSNLGSRYRPHERCATTWRLPALGAAIDAALAPWLEA
ncbi:MAG: serine hydrolase [Rubrivivax sp.]|nr:serine hydrolase [Rubrivivax sp.]